jgi:hypothetical protein
MADLDGPYIMTVATQICQNCGKSRMARYNGEWKVDELNRKPLDILRDI